MILSRRKKVKSSKPQNFLLSIFDTWQTLNEELPKEIEKSIIEEKNKEERIRKIGPRPSNKERFFTEKEIEIITNIIPDPRKSYIDISKDLGLSRHTARRRIEKMIEQEKIKIFLGINYQKLNLDFLLIDLISYNLKYLDEIFRELEMCPRVFTVVKNPLKNSLMMLLGMEKNLDEENNQVLAMIEKFQLDERIKECNVMNLYPEIAPSFLTMIPKNIPDQSKERSCQRDCDLCDNYIKGKCLGCPATKKYNPNIFKMA
ncbi:MAG: winged helix-turn-helix transcriptional regulator [Candidatus Lokiarchaeota archaeon]|nr:winged helix-turn-helix transcriptional regulator [Candidatus Lokiarchaeota archaeon]